jgi:hypothetical protein
VIDIVASIGEVTQALDQLGGVSQIGREAFNGDAASVEPKEVQSYVFQRRNDLGVTLSETVISAGESGAEVRVGRSGSELAELSSTLADPRRVRL